MIKFADERDRQYASALVQNRIDIHQEYRDEIKRLSTLKLVIKLKEVEASFAEAQEKIKGLEKGAVCAVEKALDSKRRLPR